MKIAGSTYTQFRSALHRAELRLVLGIVISLFFLAKAGSAFGQQPVISDFSPNVGAPGDTLLVSGSGFSIGSIKVYFPQGKPAAVTLRSDSLMDVIVPSGAANGPLGIQRDTGPISYTSANFTRIGTGPYISDISPLYGSTNDLVSISGVHFAGLAVDGVKFNGTRASDASVSADGTYISVHVPYGATTGPVTVTTPAGSSNSAAAFTILGPGPYITGFSPRFGSAGTTVLIDGVHFQGASSARFNGIPGSNFAIKSETLIEVRAPSGVTSGPITVTSALGTNTSAGDFFVQPVITNFVPAVGRAGTNITITGGNFRGATQVLFGGVPAVYTVLNNTTIQASVPGGATTDVLRVTTPFFSCFSSNRFKVQPTIYGSTPTFGPAGTSVVVVGANLNAGKPMVRFNGVEAANPTSVSFGQVMVLVPGGTTTGPISITTDDGSYTNASNFFLPAAITGFAPTNSPPGTQVTISGLNFLGASEVSFNGTPAPFFLINSNTSITASVPSGVSTGPITVTTPAGSITSTGRFYGAPIITGFSPSRGLPGTNVTIRGTNFLGTSGVLFNGVAGNVSSVNNSQIVAVVPEGVQTGPILIQAPAGSALTSSNFVADYSSNLEVWMTNSDSVVTIGSNLTYSITMVNRGPFTCPNARWTNTFPSSFVIDSAIAEPPWELDIKDGFVVASCPSAAAGGTSSIVISGRPQSTGMLIVSSTISSDYRDPVPGNNTVGLATWVNPPALLGIEWWTNQVKVSWSAALSNYVLQANSSAASTNGWTPVTNVPELSAGKRFITESNTAPTRFYRLMK